MINLGTGTGTTVRELVAAFHAVTGGPDEVVEVGPRPGDVIGCFTRSERARTLLEWTPERSVEDGVRDSLAWAQERSARLGV